MPTTPSPFVELSLAELQQVQHDASFNADIAPTPLAQRTWNKWHIASLWVGMAVCVPTYTLGGVLVAYFGLSTQEAIWTIFFANVIVLLPLILNAMPGTKYGIPFPVLIRSSFGIKGSNLPALMRALVACGWFGIQSMFGGLALDTLLDHLSSAWANMGGIGYVISFFLFVVFNIWIVLKGSNSIKWFEVASAPLLLLVGIGLLIWGLGAVDMRSIFHAPALLNGIPRPPGIGLFLKLFLSGLTAMVGFWATLALNIPDFSRYAKSQKDQIQGQIIGLPLTMFLFATLGVVLTAASTKIFGETISDPITLVSKISSDFWTILCMIIFLLATTTSNIAANIVSPMNDFQNLAPHKINARKGLYLTASIGVLLVIWEVLRKAGFIVSTVSLESIYSNFLLTYSSILGPIAGVMLADYFIVRKQELKLVELFKTHSIYQSYNVQGIIAFAIPALLALIGLQMDHSSWIYLFFYAWGWFTGTSLAALLYALIKKT